jgi:hypothetical protein
VGAEYDRSTGQSRCGDIFPLEEVGKTRGLQISRVNAAPSRHRSRVPKHFTCNADCLGVGAREKQGMWDRCGEAVLGLSVAYEAVEPVQHAALAPAPWRETLNSRHSPSPALAPWEPWKGREGAQSCGNAAELHDMAGDASPSRTASRFLPSQAE